MTTRNLYANPDPSMAGKPYRPSDGFEGIDFNNLFCCHCKKADAMGMCDIICDTMIYELTDPEYPKEWVYRADGQPTCTAFEEE
jgi:hypothetical protein